LSGIAGVLLKKDSGQAGMTKKDEALKEFPLFRTTLSTTLPNTRLNVVDYKL
jgi:hypothetical protein